MLAADSTELITNVVYPSSILEIGLSIFAAALTALRPLLRHLPCFTNISSGGKSNSLRLHSIKTFGQRSTTDKGRAYRLEDPDGPTADSQENIVSGRVAEIHKRTDIELNYESSPSELKQSREHW